MIILTLDFKEVTITRDNLKLLTKSKIFYKNIAELVVVKIQVKSNVWCWCVRKTGLNYGLFYDLCLILIGITESIYVPTRCCNIRAVNSSTNCCVKNVIMATTYENWLSRRKGKYLLFIYYLLKYSSIRVQI